MQIFVVLPQPNHHKHPNRIVLEVSAGDTVASLKARIKKADGVQPWRQRLVFDGSVLPDGRATLSELGVVNASTVRLVEMSMQVFVRLDKLVTFSDIASSDTVESFRARFHERMGCPPAQQRFTFSGMQQEDGHTLADYGVRDCSTLHFTPRLAYHRSRIVRLYIEVTDTVGRIKERLEEAEGVPVECQRFSVRGKELDDGRALADYDGALERETPVNVGCGRCLPESGRTTRTAKGKVPPVVTAGTGRALKRRTDVKVHAVGKRIKMGPDQVEQIPVVQRKRLTVILTDPCPDE